MTGDGMPGGVGAVISAGQMLGDRYRLVCQVGAGGTAVVWQAHDSVLARTVAVKVLANRFAGDPESRDRIREEARAAAALSHPNIAQVYDYGEADSTGEAMPYVVMELIRGGTLEQRLRGGPLLPRQAMRICAEVAAALAAAHAEGLAHRDIKPANIMLAPTGAKVVDFGIAAAIRPPGSGAADFEIFGTPAYLAPERLLHDSVEPASDVYALGVLLYRLLSGHSPWTTDTTTQMLTAHVYLDPSPLLPMFQVPDYVTALCNRCLAKDSTMRPSASEAAALLAHGAGLQVITDEPSVREQATAIDSDPSVLIRVPAAAVVPSADEATLADVPAQQNGTRPAAAGAAPAAAPTAARRRVLAAALAVAALLVAGAGTLWLTHPAKRGAPAPSSPAATAAAALPQPAASRRTATATGPGAPGADPAGPSPTAVQPPGQTVPGRPSGTAPGPPTNPGPIIVPPPGPAPVPAPPKEYTLTSAAGSVQATCPAPDTARILSWTATKPYKVTQGDKAAGAAPEVTFKHGNTQVTMTVTCRGETPSATTT